MPDTLPAIDVGRLKQAMKNASDDLQPFREARRKAVEQYAGKNWGENAAKERVPVNLLALYASIITRSLIAKDPRVMMGTFKRELKPTVEAMEDWCNKRIKQMGLAATLQRIVLDAIFSVGIGKVALQTPAEATTAGYTVPAGTPMFAVVDLDDAIWDTHARCLEEVSFVGHRYRAVADVVKDSRLFTAKRKEVEPKPDDPYNYGGDEKVSTLGRGSDSNDEEFEDYVELWEIYLPRQRVVVTIAENLEEPLRVQRWIGPACGPYHFLCMGLVPGNPYPKAPIMDLYDLHEIVNILYRKLGRQSQRQKQVLAAQAGSDEDAKRITQTNDGEAVKVDNPDRLKQLEFGGANQQNLGFAIHAKDLYSWLAGNLDALGGLGPQSQTLGQDEMLTKSASRLISDMQDRTVAYVKTVYESLAWFWWHDPYQTMRSVVSLPGAKDISLERRVTPQQRMQTPFEDLDLDVDPYSMAADTPQSRVQALTQVVTQVIIPLSGQLQQQGISLDIGAFLRKLAKYLNIPDLEEIVSIQGPPQEQAAPESQGQGEGEADYVSNAPANTSREYIRRNVPSRTRSGADNALLQTLMGGRPQEGEARQMTGAT